MLGNIYIGSVIISAILILFTLFSISIRLKKLDGYKEYNKKHKSDIFKSLSTWIILTVCCIIPIINIVVGLFFYSATDKTYEEFKIKIKYDLY